ncbi:tetratricopeptide repeat-containing sensor histidine kinase [Spirosoma pollinicola]|nr:histidine kinase dimerization/phosphoacceptor domain -containing protein [Spirosoma pollinicola]
MATAFFYSLPAFGQTFIHQVDSLQNLLKISRPDSSRVNACLALAKWYQKNPTNRSQAYLDSTLLYARQAEVLSRSLGSRSLLGQALLSKSKALIDPRARTDKQIDEARRALKEALTIYSATRDKLQWADATYLFADSFSSQDTSRLPYLQLALGMYKKIGARQLAAETLSEIALTYQLRGRIAESLRIYLRVLAIQVPFRDKSPVLTLYHLAALYKLLGNYPKALQYAYWMNRVSLRMRDTPYLSSSYDILSTLYEELGNHRAALQFRYETLRISEQENNLQAILTTRIDISRTLLALNRSQEALSQAKATLKLIEVSLPKFRLIASLIVGECYMAVRDYKSAEVYYKWTESNVQPINSPILTNINQNLGILNLKTNRLDKAALYLAKAYENEQHFKHPIHKRQILLALYQLDSTRGNTALALNHFRQYTVLNDSLVNEAKNKQITLLQIQFDTEKKVKDIKSLQQQNQLQKASINQERLVRNLTLIGILLLTFLLWLSYNRYRIKQRTNQLLESKQMEINQKNESLSHLIVEKDWLLKELHHRVKNNLQLIISLLQSQGKYLLDKSAISAIEQSEHRVRAMALIHQKLYRDENISQIDMRAYIQEVAEQLSDSFDLEHRIAIHYNLIPMELDVSQAIPLGLIINEAITNAFKYAFPHEQSGNIYASLAKAETGRYLLQVKDDGVGLPSGVDLKQSNSMGANIMRGLSQQLGSSLEVTSGQGLEVSVLFEVFNPRIIPTHAVY